MINFNASLAFVPATNQSDGYKMMLKKLAHWPLGDLDVAVILKWYFLNSYQGYMSQVINNMDIDLVVECGCRQCGAIDKNLEEWWQHGRIPEGQASSRNMLFIWWNPNLNKKSSTTLYPALTYYTSPTKCDAKAWMSKSGNLSAMTLERGAGRQG